jgi:hypothetical protein
MLAQSSNVNGLVKLSSRSNNVSDADDSWMSSRGELSYDANGKMKPSFRRARTSAQSPATKSYLWPAPTGVN